MSRMGAFVLQLQEFQQAAYGLNMDESRALMETFFEDDSAREYAWTQYEQMVTFNNRYAKHTLDLSAAGME